jgi:hypothetical protein
MMVPNLYKVLLLHRALALSLALLYCLLIGSRVLQVNGSQLLTRNTQEGTQFPAIKPYNGEEKVL